MMEGDITSVTRKDRFSIAVMMPARTPFIESMFQGFAQELHEQSPFSFTYQFFDAHGDLQIMRKQIDTILAGSFDLVFSMGINCTLMAQQVALYKHHAIPIVFAALPEQFIEDFLVSDGCCHGNVTGVMQTTTIYQVQASLLSQLKDDLKNVLVVFNPKEQEGFLSCCYQECAASFARQGVRVHPLEVVAQHEVVEGVRRLLPGMDAVVVLRDHTTLACVEQLAALCNEHHTTLVASDLLSVDKGAALGVSCSETSVGKLAAQKVRLIIEQHQHPSHIPLTHETPTFSYKINTKTMLQQGLMINKRILALLDAVRFV